MEITRQKIGENLVIRLAGRLDASWCVPVQRAITDAIHEGEHRLQVDMAKVDYISSTGLRVLLAAFKQLRAIKGHFNIVNPSPAVESVLKLAGLATLAVSASAEKPGAVEKGIPEVSERAHYHVYSLPGAGFRLSATGDPRALEGSPAPSQKCVFGEKSFAVGIGALGNNCESRFGEFLALAGAAAFQPTDDSSRPDFMVSEEDLLPDGQLLLGLIGQGDFAQLARFEARPESRTIGLAELAETALRISGASVVALAVITETAGLVGTTLRQSPALPPSRDRFGFPQIRDWLAFSNESIFRDSSALIVGVAAREGSAFQTLLRPLGPGLLGHFHAAAFPYRPLSKGMIDLKAAVLSLFENDNLSAVLHLLSDTRPFTGAGESQFFRGALWIAPVTESETP